MHLRSQRRVVSPLADERAFRTRGARHRMVRARGRCPSHGQLPGLAYVEGAERRPRDRSAAFSFRSPDLQRHPDRALREPEPQDLAASLLAGRCVFPTGHLFQCKWPSRYMSARWLCINIRTVLADLQTAAAPLPSAPPVLTCTNDPWAVARSDRRWAACRYATD